MTWCERSTACAFGILHSHYSLRRIGPCWVIHDDAGEIICELADRDTAYAIWRRLQAEELALPVRDWYEVWWLATEILRVKWLAGWRGRAAPLLWLYPSRRCRRCPGSRYR